MGPPDISLDHAFELFRRPDPTFSKGELSTLMNFVHASGIKPEGAGGKFSLASRPYLKDLYAEERDSYEPRVVVMKAAQTGLTIKLIYRGLWWVADARERINTALMFPTKDAVEDLHKSRFRPMARSSSKIMDLTADVDAVSLVQVGISNMRFRGMRTGIGVDSFPADVMMFDEVRLMDLATIERAFVRVSESELQDEQGRRGVIELNSTAGFPDMDIDRWFQRSTQSYWHTPCPNPGCRNNKWGVILPLRWPDCVGQAGNELYYKCPDCDTPIPDHVLFNQGWYLAQNPGSDWRGYQFSQVLKGNKFLPELWGAYTRGDNESEFWNSRMGLPFQDPDAIPVTKSVLESCIDDNFEYLNPEDVETDLVGVGIDQRAPEKHVCTFRVGADGRYELLDLAVIEASGVEAIERTVAYCRKWRARVVVLDGEPSYDYAVGVANRLPRKVAWLADYGEIPGAIEFKDDRDKKSIKKASGEVKYAYRALMNRYKALDWALTRFALGEIRLPRDFYTKHGLRRKDGVLMKHSFGREFQQHMQNIARAVVPKTTLLPTGERVFSGEVRRIYRHLALDPHYAHAYLYALAGLQYMRGTTSLGMIGHSAPKARENQLEVGMPDGLKPSSLLRQKEKSKEKVCGNCKHWRSLSGEQGLCGSPHNVGKHVSVKLDTPKCNQWRRKR